MKLFSLCSFVFAASASAATFTNSAKFRQPNSAGASALADWMTGPSGQAFLIEFGKKSPGGIPLFHAVNPPEKHADSLAAKQLVR